MAEEDEDTGAPRITIDHKLTEEDVIEKLTNMPGVSGVWEEDRRLCRFSVNVFKPPVTGTLVVTALKVEVWFNSDGKPLSQTIVGFIENGMRYTIASPKLV